MEWLGAFLVVVFLLALNRRVRRVQRVFTPRQRRTAYTDPNQHFDFVSDPDVSFGCSRIMNKSEYFIYRTLLNFINSPQQPARSLLLFSQVAASAIIRTEGPSDKSRKAYDSVRFKVFDFVIVNRSGYPLVVVEYNGAGHYQANAEFRDAVKREACARAGIAFVAIEADEEPSQFLPRVAAALAPTPPS